MERLEYAVISEMSDTSERDKILELIRAEEQGLLIKLPCKVGDMVYRIFNGKIETMSVDNVLYESLFNRFKVFCTPYICIYWKDSFNKTVFLTRDEAEKALKGSVSHEII